ncbi:MAG: universal stress protein [Hyphomicrobiales bacterium]|jgi:nucleotide-binding universal stress UspA family protein|nr:universal stress protein [Hyphomicrobiales bacterium]
MSTPTRRAYEPGHRPKFMVVVDDTDECSRAVRFAARRAARIGSGVLLAAVISPVEISQWRGVEEVMQAEALEQAERQLDSAAAIVRAVAGLEPERIVRQGSRADEILKIIAGDEDVALLILAAGTDSEGPGPLVANLAGRSSGHFPVPLAIVPGHLSDQDIDGLA